MAVSTVYVVDDSPDMTRLLHALLTNAGYPCKIYTDSREFLSDIDSQSRGCVILDHHMPHFTGGCVQRELKRRKIQMPLIFLTGESTVTTAVRVMKYGAFDLLEKPLVPSELLRAVTAALRFEEESMLSEQVRKSAHARLESLSPREREVCDLIANGASNKQAAFQLKISERTIEVHRARVMSKMTAETLSDLIRTREIAIQKMSNGERKQVEAIACSNGIDAPDC